jgi:DNA-binding IclR family transcriptional regulator
MQAMAADTTADSTAPALTRGVAILRRLERDGPQSLEQLTRQTGYPKTSVARLLKAMEQMGLVCRDSKTRAYRADVALRPINSPRRWLCEHCALTLDTLCEKVTQTVELHQYDSGRLTMIDRREPQDAVVKASARIGWQRDLDELDALTQVVLAFGRCDPLEPATRYWHWKHDRHQSVSLRRLREVVKHAAETGAAVDLGVNSHGVRRYAAPLLTSADQLAAVIAIAEAVNPNHPQVQPDLRQAVCDAARLIGRIDDQIYTT